ncbi:MAG: hypothetical protein JWR53_2130 [Glaciihabitans sp.]|nr:hypothetical protein [Glaciihabitans sp.]MCU1535649.1 hypothetical protein [Glaciihabitans sp.]
MAFVKIFPGLAKVVLRLLAVLLLALVLQGCGAHPSASPGGPKELLEAISDARLDAKAVSECAAVLPNGPKLLAAYDSTVKRVKGFAGQRGVVDHLGRGMPDDDGFYSAVCVYKADHPKGSAISVRYAAVWVSNDGTKGGDGPIAFFN